MANNLVIVESPAKAKTIGRFLGRGYKIEASNGHIRDLPKSQIGVDIENNFEPKYITIRGKGDLISKLKKEAKNSDKIYLATDPDREGEAISWHLAQLLGIDDKEKCRITFNEITQNAVKNAINNPREINLDLVDAQQARRVLDRIVGYKISPLLWKKVRKGLSAGRVQSVATRLIVDREEEIEKFIPEEYWSINAILSKVKSRHTFESKFYGRDKSKIELENKGQVDEILRALENAKYIVKNIKKSEKKKSPSPPFTTSTLQQEASRKLGFPTRKTMMVAQQLYEGVDVKEKGTVGLVTYIRTDSVRVSNEAQKEALDLIKKRYGQENLPAKPNVYTNKSAAQDAHEAIRPTYVNLEPDSLKDSLNRDQYKLYKLIWERFIASQMASAVYDTVSVDIEANGYIFKSNGSKLKFPGFMSIYIEGRDEEADYANKNASEDENTNIPDLKEGEVLDLKEISPQQHFTQPPPRYTEASLVKALEEKGIGRPSTYAPVITTIISRGYVEKDKKILYPTELGKIVTDIMKEYFKDIVDVDFTARMEKDLDDVEEGHKDWVQMMREFYPAFEDVLKEAESKLEKVELPVEETDIKCEKCGRNMVIKMGRFGKFLACPGFPECRNAKPILEEAGVDCPKCGGKVIIKKTKKGRKYIGCENNPKCDFMSWDLPAGENCPKCGSFMVKKFVKKRPVIQCIKCDYEKGDK
ncbi:MAG TPA: type I DNA topoisomerase [Clostridiaceae bacterium]|nr:type I DNA topoisomerase [Clostridiaceae bacterium]